MLVYHIDCTWRERERERERLFNCANFTILFSTYVVLMWTSNIYSGMFLSYLFDASAAICVPSSFLAHKKSNNNGNDSQSDNHRNSDAD